MKQAKVKHPHHKVRFLGGRYDHVGEVTLVGSGKKSYVLIDPPPVVNGCLHFSGAVALRRLAQAILKEVGDA